VSRSAGCRTIVLGAGLAGSLAALVCSAAGHETILIERDTTTVGMRAGAAHGQQLHNLLGRAVRHLCDLLPGFASSFAVKGGQRARVASQTHVFELGWMMPERDLGLEIWSSRKSVLDEAVAEAVAATTVRRMLDRRADGIAIAGTRVVGALVDGELIEADLVVDAMGAKSPMPRWLALPVDVDEYVVRQWYTTMPVRRPPSMLDSPDFWLTFPTYPHTRGGLVSPIDGQTWNVSLSGGPDDRPPRTPAEFVEYARTLEHPGIGELIGAGTPEAPPHTFGKPVASWRRYDKARVPAGLISVGDAVADLNPLTGQGISVMVWALADLAGLLDELADLDEVAAVFRERAAAIVGAAWDVTTLYDPAAGGVTLLADDYARIVELVSVDPEAHRRYVEIWHLLRPATELRDFLGRLVPEGEAR
jgi:flavin-dependent dehydrogenase